MTHSDQELLNLIKNNDSSHYGFNLLVKQHQQKVYWIIRRMLISHEDSNDAVQEVFIKVWKSILDFKEQSNLATWIYRIAVNEAITKLRKKRNMFFIPIVDVEKELSILIDFGDQYSGDEIQKKLQKAILMLPVKQRMVFNLKYFEELKYTEISELLGVSEGGLKAQYHHAVKKIEQFLQID